jgi:hypothetical protein
MSDHTKEIAACLQRADASLNAAQEMIAKGYFDRVRFTCACGPVQANELRKTCVACFVFRFEG